MSVNVDSKLAGSLLPLAPVWFVGMCVKWVRLILPKLLPTSFPCGRHTLLLFTFLLLVFHFLPLLVALNQWLTAVFAFLLSPFCWAVFSETFSESQRDSSDWLTGQLRREGAMSRMMLRAGGCPVAFTSWRVFGERERSCQSSIIAELDSVVIVVVMMMMICCGSCDCVCDCDGDSTESLPPLPLSITCHCCV